VSGKTTDRSGAANWRDAVNVGPAQLDAVEASRHWDCTGRTRERIWGGEARDLVEKRFGVVGEARDLVEKRFGVVGEARDLVEKRFGVVGETRDLVEKRLANRESDETSRGKAFRCRRRGEGSRRKEARKS
jgi:hypothetical protein